jgi:hypothetical protein
MIPSILDEIRKRMRHGDSIDDVDVELIEHSGLSADEKAALWLYAWSFVPRRKQRASAELHLRLVAPGRFRRTASDAMPDPHTPPTLARSS